LACSDPEEALPVYHLTYCRRLLALACVSLFLAPSAFTQVDRREPLLILDVKAEKQKEPFAFRTTKDPIKQSSGMSPSREGLDALNASGSASFSEASLRKIRDKIPAKTFTVVDLRQEAHGFIDGLSVCWWSERNQANKGKALEQVLADEAERLARLKKAATVTVNQIKTDDQEMLEQATPVRMDGKSIRSEQEVCRANGLGYVRIPVTDREKPEDDQVDRFVRLIQALPEGEWLHFHCKAGNGRTTTFLAMYDMMRNARKVSLEDIALRQRLLGGANLLTDPPPDSWRYPGAVGRRKFLEKFYQYCRANADGFKQPWSEWSAREGK
jgi:protein tyrosine phosphatase (PTP) superfamily phosphohydrolase (DUF442 family)